MSFNFLVYEGFVDSYLFANVMAVLIRRWSGSREILHRFPSCFSRLDGGFALLQLNSYYREDILPRVHNPIV